MAPIWHHLKAKCLRTLAPLACLGGVVRWGCQLASVSQSLWHCLAQVPSVLALGMGLIGLHALWLLAPLCSSPLLVPPTHWQWRPYGTTSTLATTPWTLAYAGPITPSGTLHGLHLMLEDPLPVLLPSAYTARVVAPLSLDGTQPMLQPFAAVCALPTAYKDTLTPSLPTPSPSVLLGMLDTLYKQQASRSFCAQTQDTPQGRPHSVSLSRMVPPGVLPLRPLPELSQPHGLLHHTQYTLQVYPNTLQGIPFSLPNYEEATAPERLPLLPCVVDPGYYTIVHTL
jgi:hypothetical protein